MTEIESRHFRDVLGSFATGVTVVSTCDEAGKPVAMTVNSFASVSLDPPLVLWSISRDSDLFDAFAATDHYAVHILRQDQEEMSNHFAMEAENKFADVAYEKGIANLPLLTSYCARLQCKIENRYEGGDHIILVGRVLDLDYKPGPPLVFQGGKYQSLK